jgi:DNA polymerase III subunit epsilon
MQESGLDSVVKKPGVYIFEDEAAAPAGALRLESQMVKQLLPVYNKQLRRSSSQTVLQKHVDNNGYIVIELSNQDLGRVDSLEDIYGVYPNKSKAKAVLEQHLRSFQLCSKLLNLERTKGACFLHQLGKCRGACAGKEPAEQYNARVELALERSKLESWPYGTPIALQVSEDRAIVVDKWVVLGHIEAGTDTPYLEGVAPSFDVDTYRILRGFLKTHANSGMIRPYPI